MKRDEYLSDEYVSGFTKWAGQLVTGDLELTHRWKSRGTEFSAPASMARWSSTAGRITAMRWITG